MVTAGGHGFGAIPGNPKSNSRVRLHSVDIFDTVLVRAVADPAAVFLLLGRVQASEGLTGLTAEMFARARRAAENRARAHHGEATSLDHILRELSWALAIEPESVRALRARELELEARLFRAVPHASALLKQLRTEARVAFVSDTYYSSAYLQEQLCRHGLWNDCDALYASCEIGYEKRTSRIFRLIARRESVLRREIVHHGNDVVADMVGPRRARVPVHPMTAANPNRYEQILEGYSFATGGLSSLLAGASRLARLQESSAEEDAAAIGRVAAGVVAPTLFGYVVHILRDAARRGLERLYFVSRDGELMRQVALGLAGRAGGPDDLRYLHGSRQAWHLPAITEVDDDQLSWILDATYFRSVRTILARLRLVPEMIGGTLEAAGFPPSLWSDHLSPGRLRSLGAVLQTASVADLVIATADVQRSLLLGYLDQEGLTEDVRYGVVDLGWYGRLGSSLSTVLHGAGAPGPSVFYFLGLKSTPPAAMVAVSDAYLFDSGRRVGGPYAAIPGLVTLLETFCAGSQGMTVGYERTATGVQPVLRQAENEAVLTWGLPVLRAAVDRFVEVVTLDTDIADLGADLRPAITAVLEAFALRPDRDEARAWGSFPFNEDQTEAFTRPLAYPYEFREAMTALVLGRERNKTHRYWPGASRRLSNPVLDTLMGGPLEYSGRAQRKARRLVRTWAEAPNEE